MRSFIRQSILSTCLIGALSIPVLSRGATTFGNPTTSIVGVGSGSIYIDTVIAKPCSAATQTIVVDDWVSNSSSIDLLLGQQSWCQLYVNLKWTTSGSVVEVEVDGFDVYQTVNGAADWVIQLDESSETATLVTDTGKA